MNKKDLKLSEEFYKEQRAHSEIKSKIVAEYFPKYCKVLINSWALEKIIYLDLFSGPGIFKDNKPSTPHLITESTIKIPELSDKVLLMFNDLNYSDVLKEHLESNFDLSKLKHTPRFGKKDVGSYTKIKDYLSKQKGSRNPTPTLLFYDPFGYKEIDTRILGSFLKNKGNELFLFVNTKRINPGLDNNKFEGLMRSLFPTSYEKLQNDRKFLGTVHQRLKLIMDNLVGEFRAVVGSSIYATDFKFQEHDSSATSHYLLHVSTHHRGFDIVKQIFHDYDNIGADLEGDHSYTFDEKTTTGGQELLNFEDVNIIRLAENLKSEFKGQEILTSTLFEKHQKNSNYCKTHYSKSLKYLFENQDIKRILNEKDDRDRVIVSNTCLIKFN